MPHYRYLDSGTLLKKLVLNGRYISMIGRSVIEPELKAGTLVVLPWVNGPITGDLVAVYRKGTENPHRACFLEIVSRTFRNRKP